MKATELMIGDWVFNKHHNKNICLTVYDFFTHGHNKETGEQYLTEFSKPSFFLDKEPIPLTAEILKANEFELDTPCKMLYQPQEVNGIPNISGKYQYVEATFRRDEIYKIEIHNSWNNIEYGVVLRSTVMVHELQHALRLCGLNKIANNFKLQQL